ncbi:MAG: hypothetical protein MUE41_05770 [Gemmatimonadaceae bacterium]|nr:hypothetical protein [Gemmatimonadaceae bacterium]
MLTGRTNGCQRTRASAVLPGWLIHVIGRMRARELVIYAPNKGAGFGQALQQRAAPRPAQLNPSAAAMSRALVKGSTLVQHDSDVGQHLGNQLNEPVQCRS